MSMLCGVLKKGSAWKLRTQAASFPSWGLARRHVIVRKELSLGVGNSMRNTRLAQLGKARKRLKSVTSSEAATCPKGPGGHHPQQTALCTCRLQGAPPTRRRLPFNQSQLHVPHSPGPTFSRTRLGGDVPLEVFQSAPPRARAWLASHWALQ